MSIRSGDINRRLLDFMAHTCISTYLAHGLGRTATISQSL